MAQPMEAAAETSLGGRSQGLPGALVVGVLRAVLRASDANAAVSAGVERLSSALGGLAWVAADVDLDGRLEVVAVSGTRVAALDAVSATAAAGAEPWRASLLASGLELRAWHSLESAWLPSAALGLALPASGGPALIDGAGGAEADALAADLGDVARLIGAVVDAREGRAAGDGLRSALGRLAWLETSRRVGRALRHDLANHVQAISFYGSQLVADFEEGTPDVGDAEAIGDAVGRVTRLLEQMRDLWRDPAEPEVVPLDPAAVVDGIAPILDGVASPSSLEVGPLASMVVRAPRRALEEALMALVADARAAAGAKPGSIAIGTGAEVLEDGNALALAPGRYAAVYVHDDAPPLSPEVAVRAPLSLDAVEPGGPGFGLALASAVSRAVSGGLRVERAEAGGTRVTLLLPEATSSRRLNGLTAADHQDGTALSAQADQARRA